MTTTRLNSPRLVLNPYYVDLTQPALFEPLNGLQHLLLEEKRAAADRFGSRIEAVLTTSLSGVED